MTPPLTLTFDGPLALLTLDDGRGNALGTPMLEALDVALAEAAERAGALVLRGREKVFSGGLDLPQVLTLDRSKFAEFLHLFNRVHDRLLAFPVPIVTAARGHAIAGGAILLCAGDVRLVTPGGRAGITEVAMGVNIPSSALELVRLALGERFAAEAAQTGRLYEGADRVRVGFATEEVAPEALDARALEIARNYAKNDRRAYAALRLALRAQSLDRVARESGRDSATFLDLWFQPTVQERLKAIAARLTAK